MRTIDYIDNRLKEVEALLLTGDMDELGKVVREMRDRVEFHKQKYPETQWEPLP